MTLTDEGTIDGGVTKRRQQKIYSDVLGRTVKTEVLNWQGGSVYSATVNTYNARDQITLIRQYAGLEGSGTFQDTIMTYDGRGRLKTKHVPEQNAGTATTWDYNSDDTIQKVTDARGASASYSYNSRHLVTSINYSAPAGITPTSNVTYGYDAAGNRTSMTDGLGSVSYVYDQLSRMTSESRFFSALGQSYTLSYDFNLAGQLKRVTDHTGMTINYGFDNTGRLSNITGADNLFMGITNYASNFQYRAWGGLKAMTDGSGHISSLLYNSKLLPTHFNLSNGQVSQNYTYHNDGRLSFVQNTTDVNFDRSYSYDHMARLGGAATGGGARGDSGATPYNEGFGYDAFNNLNSRYTLSWGQDGMTDGATYTNNRRSGWGYDANGNNTTIGSRTYQFDAAGQMTLMTGQRWVINHYITVSQSAAYDGDGQKVKDVSQGLTTYYLRSSVLGGTIIEEVNSSGQKTVGYVYSPDGVPVARQSVAGSNSYITWKRSSPAGTGEHDYNVGYGFGSGSPQRTELDPLGAAVPLEYTPPPEVQNEGDVGQIGGIFDSRWSNFFDLSGGCTAGGVAASCRDAASALNNLGVMRPNLIQVTINITYRNGSRVTMQFVTTSNVIKSGFNHTFTGGAAVAAATSWNRGLRGGLDNALLGALVAGFATEAAEAAQQRRSMQRRGYNGKQNGFEWTREEKGKLDRAVDIALKLLSSNSECAALLGEASSSAYEVLKGMSERSASFLNRSQTRPIRDGVQTIAWTRTVSGIPLMQPQVDLYAGFFDNRREFGLNRDQTRALTILHELGHVTYQYFHSKVAALLGAENLTGEQVDRLIYEKCFSTPLPKGVAE